MGESTTDLDGHPRVLLGICGGSPRRDKGAFEFLVNCPAPTCQDQSVAVSYNSPGTQVALGCTLPNNGDTLAYSIISQPQHGTLSTPDAGGHATYTPNTGYSGSDSFTFKATNHEGAASATKTTTLNVAAAPPCQNPVICNATPGSLPPSYYTTASGQNYVPSPGPGVPQSHGTAEPSPAPITRAELAALLTGEVTPAPGAAKIGAVLAHGGYALAFKALEAGTAIVDWYQVPQGGRLAKTRTLRVVLVASGRQTFAAAGTATIQIRLTSAGKRLLRHAKKIKLIAKGSFTPTHDQPVNATRTLLLKR